MKERSLRSLRGLLPALAALALGLAPAFRATACTVCYGAADSPIIDGAEKASFLLIGITYFLLVGGVVGFVAIRRKKIAELASASKNPGSSTQ